MNTMRDYPRKPNPIKQYIGQPSRAEKRILALEERRERYEALAMKRTGVYSGGMPGGIRRVSSTEHYVCKIVDVEREIARKIDELADLVWIVEYEIGLLTDARYRDILTWRYLNGWGWDEIAEGMHYDRRQVHRLHGEALMAFGSENKHVPKCHIQM